MPTCKGCGRFGNVPSIDPCPHCGAKDWMLERGENYATNPSELIEVIPSSPYKKDSQGCGCLSVAALAWLGLMLAVLWLLVAVVKWMWQHS